MYARTPCSAITFHFTVFGFYYYVPFSFLSFYSLNWNLGGILNTVYLPDNEVRIYLDSLKINFWFYSSCRQRGETLVSTIVSLQGTRVLEVQGTTGFSWPSCAVLTLFRVAGYSVGYSKSSNCRWPLWTHYRWIHQLLGTTCTFLFTLFIAPSEKRQTWSRNTKRRNLYGI